MAVLLFKANHYEWQKQPMNGALSGDLQILEVLNGPVDEGVLCLRQLVFVHDVDVGRTAAAGYNYSCSSYIKAGHIL